LEVEGVVDDGVPIEEVPGGVVGQVWF